MAQVCARRCKFLNGQTLRCSRRTSRSFPYRFRAETRCHRGARRKLPMRDNWEWHVRHRKGWLLVTGCHRIYVARPDRADSGTLERMGPFSVLMMDVSVGAPFGGQSKLGGGGRRRIVRRHLTYRSRLATYAVSANLKKPHHDFLRMVYWIW